MFRRLVKLYSHETMYNHGEEDFSTGMLISHLYFKFPNKPLAIEAWLQGWIKCTHICKPPITI